MLIQEITQMNLHTISDKKEKVKEVWQLSRSGQAIELSPESVDKTHKCREFLDKLSENTQRRFYGINTGFGSLCDVRINQEELGKLQENLVISHACGIGKTVPPEIVKLMLYLKIKSLSFGHSGISTAVLSALISMYNQNLLPLIYENGSLGASGDLAPLAHLSLPLIGKGKLYENGQIKETSQSAFASSRITLKSKEGLALLNGTQFMSAYGVYCISKAKHLLKLANKIAALSLDVFECRSEPFSAQLHDIRPHKGQQKVARHIRNLLADSPIFHSEKKQVQDPYSFRCIPQVHGAVWQALNHCEKVFETEINSVTDNPNIFPDEELILSGGNFHGEALAMAFDYLKIALAELGNISERRTYLLISGKRGLPDFLANNAGLESGMMIPQYTAAGLVSKNKQLATPASVDSIVSSNGQEDHVSMGANAAVQCYELLHNTMRVLAIELLTAKRASLFRDNFSSSTVINEFIAEFDREVKVSKAESEWHLFMQQAEVWVDEQTN